MPEEDPPGSDNGCFVWLLVLPVVKKCNVGRRRGSRELRGQRAREGRALVWDQNS